MRVTVFLNCEGKRQEVGTLDDGDCVRFQYSPKFVTQKLSLSPLKVPLSPTLWQNQSGLNNGLPGFVADSLPDGWGDLLLSRQLRRKGRKLEEVSPLERLCWVGRQGMGALEYEPESEHDLFEPQDIRLDSMAEDVEAVMAETPAEQVVDRLCSLNGSSGGARPKIVCLMAEDGSGRLKRGVMSEPGWTPWLIKFRHSSDASDQGVQEFICSELMRRAGLDVPATKLFASKKGAGWFGVERFDRTPKGKLHMVTVAGLLECNFRIPSLDYQSILMLTRILVGPGALLEQFKRCVFAFLIGNCDDHAKNFSFLMDGKGKWRVSPAYDMVTAAGMRGEHATSIMGVGKNPRRQDFLDLAGSVDISARIAEVAMDEVCTAVSHYPEMAQQFGVGVPDAVRFELKR